MTVGRMLREMTVREFAAWRIRFAEQPWGTRAADLMNAHWISLYANAHRDTKKRAEPYRLDEWLLFQPRDEEEAEKPKDIVRPETRDWFYRVAVPVKPSDGN